MYDKAEWVVSYIIDSGHYRLCGAGCSVKNLGKRRGIESDPEQLEGYAAVFAPSIDGNPEHVFSVNYQSETGKAVKYSKKLPAILTLSALSATMTHGEKSRFPKYS